MNPLSFDEQFDDTPETKKIASQITNSLSNDSLKFIALYSWVTKNISYDDERLKNVQKAYFKGKSRTLNNCSETLSKRKAICSGYVFLLSAMCNSIGIKNMPIKGYGRTSNEQVDEPDHAWIAFKLSKNWYLADPTWDSEIIFNNQKKGLNDTLFLMLEPKKFLKTHFPLDPLWQLNNNLLTISEWKENHFIEKSSSLTTNFNATDSLQKFENETITEKFFNSMNRIVKEKEYAYNGFNEMAVYYSVLLGTEGNNYTLLNNQLNSNNKDISAMAKKVLPLKHELYLRLSKMENYHQKLKFYTTKLSNSLPTKLINGYNLDDKNESIKNIKLFLIDERKYLDATIKQLESLRKK
jgi:hypothetical protein